MDFIIFSKTVILPFLTSFFFSFLLYPIYIKVALKKKLFDFPKLGRKSHDYPIPSMGGGVMFIVTFFTLVFWYPKDDITFFKYFFTSSLIFSILGVKDDIIGVSSVKKLFLHFVVAFIMVFIAGLRITSFYNLFGEVNIPTWVFFFVSLLFYTTIINSFNLIDGIDGLAGVVSIFVLSCYAVLFYFLDDKLGLIISVILLGCLLAFLFYNYPPAKLFMGDTGSIFLGFVIAVLSVMLLENPHFHFIFKNIYKPFFILSIIIYPLLDLLRVFFVRIIKGKSPFKADKVHIHYLLREIGFSDRKSLFIILTFSFFSVLIVYFLRFQSNFILLSIYFSYLLICFLLLKFLEKKHVIKK